MGSGAMGRVAMGTQEGVLRVLRFLGVMVDLGIMGEESKAFGSPETFSRKGFWSPEA